MNTNHIAEAAHALRTAELTRTSIPPLTETYPEMTVHDAYAIQVALAQKHFADGRNLIGHKIGLTSKAMQRQMGVDTPDYGHLFADMVQNERGVFLANDLISPRVEPEIAFVLKSPLCGPGVTADDVLSAVDYSVASLEVVDSRIADWRIKLEDTIADNGSSARIVLGSVRVPADDLDLKALSVRVFRNGAEVGQGTGAAILGSPLNAVAWLANALGERGVTLEAGHLILPGAMTASVPAGPGDVITADFDHLGTVKAEFRSSDETPA